MATATKSKSKAAITTTAGDLRAALASVKSAVPGKTPKPILHNVHVADGLMTATDLELAIDVTFDYHGDPLLLPHARLDQILASVSRDAEVTITPSGSKLVIKAGGGRWEIPTEDAAEFPRWEAASAKPVARLPADQFVRAIAGTAYAADVDSVRYAMGCVVCDVADGVATFVATDGRRLSTVECEIDQAVDDSSTMIPTRAAVAMAALARNSESSVQLEATPQEVVCTLDSATITARLVAGKFPRWRDVFPERESSPNIVQVTGLLSAVRAAAVCTSEQSKGVRFEFGSLVTLSSRSAEAGEATIHCDITTVGREATVVLNPRYVVDFLQGLDDDPHVEIDAAGAGDAVILKCGDAKGVIMPLSEDGN